VVRADLVADAAGLLDPAWLTAQRWYGANDRTLSSVSLADAAPMPVPGGPAWLLVLEAAFAAGPPIRYLVPSVASAPDGRLAEPGDGEGLWRSLAAAIVEHEVLAGDSGTFRCEPAASAASLTSGPQEIAGLVERRLGVEQTNTSVTLGARLILKVYRRLEPGENPELEVGSFLESVGCRVVPRIGGWVRYLDGGTAAAAILQERVTTSGDAWRELSSMLGGDEGSEAAALAAAAEIGAVSAELHAGLAARPEDLTFPVRMATGAEIRSWQALAGQQVDRAVEAVSGEERAALDEMLPRIRARMAESFGDIERVRVTRIHGDYHLGQLLRTPGGYVVIDFEGEPARPLAERRAPAPPERDLAGMLRSFDYAARTAERGARGGFEADAWLARARSAFLEAYAAAAPASPDPRLVAAFELEKACYEVAYEAANRPDWTWLPLEALARLV
jgi:trehalose synthase-fused probable maltokinase